MRTAMVRSSMRAVAVVKREACLEPVLDGAIGDRHREVRLARPGRAAGDESGPLHDQFGAEEAAERRQAEAGLKGEVELVDGLQEGEMCPAHA